MLQTMLRGSEENAAPWLETEVLLPSQVWNVGPLRLVPELRLAAAVLEDAIRVLRGRAEAGGRFERDFFDTRRWLRDDDRAWPFAFRNVCELLALDPIAVRMQMESLQPDDTGFARRKVTICKASSGPASS